MKMTRKEFLRASTAAAGAAFLGGAAGVSTASATASTANRPQGQMTLIKGATILSMDPKLGDIYGGDVLIDGSKIVEVGHNIKAPNADFVDAKDMILMPGMCDGHRHLWESMQVTRPDLTLVTWHLMWTVGMKPEDAYDFAYLGGKMAIDAGVTRVIDYSHISHTPEKMEAAIRGAIASGIGGVNCPQLGGTVTFVPGDTVDFQTAWNTSRTSGATGWHFDLAERLRDELFSDNNAPLQFGLAHTAIGSRPREQIQAEWARVWSLEPVMVTTHTPHAYGGRDAKDRVIPDLYKAGLLRGKNRGTYIVGHGNGLPDEELLMLKDVGAGIAATPRPEVRMDEPMGIGSCFKLDVPIALGVDHLIYSTTDYFEQIRSADVAMWAGRSYNKEIAKTMTARDFMHIATLGGAKAMGMDSKVGSITPGKLADLVLLRTDRLGFPEIDDLAERVMTFAGIQDIDSVWVHGKLQKKGGQLVDFDKGLYKKAIKNWDIARAAGETIRFTGEDGKILSPAYVRSPSFNPGRPAMTPEERDRY